MAAAVVIITGNSVPESPSDGNDNDDGDSPPCTEACTVTVDYLDDDSDLWDSEGSSATIMDLKDDPHPDCCIGNPLSDRAAERLLGVVYLFIQVKTLTRLPCLIVNDSACTACRTTSR